MAAIDVGTRVRAKHGWTGTVIGIGRRPKRPWIDYAPGVRGDGTDVYIEWDETDHFTKEKIVGCYPLETVGKLERIELKGGGG